MIGLAVIVAIPVMFTVGVKAYEEIDYYFYKQAKKPARELGKDEQTLATSIHSALKNKNRENAYAMHCMDGSNWLRDRKWKDERFNEFWEQAKDEDYSESTVRLELYNGKQSGDIFIENIKADDGDIFSRRFGIAGAPTYQCSSFTAFYDYENKAYYSSIKD